jgi:2-hydroxychromene-2-carboxylate isomerase
MPQALDFYFDFSSPYGYIASHKIETLAKRHGRDVNWRPVLLGAVMKITGGAPLPNIPLKGDYARRDFLRSARLHGVDFRLPSAFPIASQAPARAFYWLKQTDPARAKQLAAALYRAYFVDDVNISNPEDTVAVSARFGLDADTVRAALNDATVKDMVKNEVDAAIKRGVFGSPYILVDGEPFWGMDRFDQIDKWLATGGW